MLLEQIKSDSLIARKARQTDTAALLITLYSEASMVGKNAGNRESIDAEVLQVIEKFVKNANEVKDILLKNNKDANHVENEILVLSKYLPKKMGYEELGHIIRGIIKGLTVTEDKSPKLMGEVMGMLKLLHGGEYDGKMASEIVKKGLVN